jgi:hypothetical protein
MAVADFGGKVNGKPITVVMRITRTRRTSRRRGRANGSIATASIC